MENRTMTCIVCPRGCKMSVEIENQKVLSCQGNFCIRGKKYAEAEIVAPERTLTTTVKTNSSDVPFLPVKTSRPIPKDKMFEAMELISKITVSVPIKVGDNVVIDFIDRGTNLIAGREILK